MKWYYTKNARQFGPIETEDLKYLYATGKLDPEELIWNESMPLWLPANQVPDIASPAPNNPTPVAQSSSDTVLNYQAPTQTPQIPYANVILAPTNHNSRTSLNFGLISVFSSCLYCLCLYYVSPILGLISIINGAVALKRIRDNPKEYCGKNEAIYGIILGLLGILISIYFIYFNMNCRSGLDFH